MRCGEHDGRLHFSIFTGRFAIAAAFPQAGGIVAERLAMGAVGFSPRSRGGMRPRRVATPETGAAHEGFKRRYATRGVPRPIRGLKSTATFTASLREAGAILPSAAEGS